MLIKKEVPGLNIKADTYVLETNVHYPTDMNLLWDAGRKCLDLMGKFSEQHGLSGWRKHKFWCRGLKHLFRSASRAASSGGKYKQERMALAVGAYLDFTQDLEQKISQSTS